MPSRPRRQTFSSRTVGSASSVSDRRMAPSCPFSVSSRRCRRARYSTPRRSWPSRCSISGRLAGSAERLLQQPEIRPPFLVQHHGLAVDDHGRRSQRPGGLFDRRKPVRPVMTPASKDADPCRLDVDRQPIAIPLQLPAPLVTSWWMGLQLRQRGLDAIRHRIEQKLWLCRITLPMPL